MMEMDMQADISTLRTMAVAEHSILTKLVHLITTGLKWKVLVVLALCVSTKTIKAQQSVADIGEVKELSGYTKVIRDDEYDPTIKFPIQSLDDVRTSNGRIAIEFLDESQVKLTEHSSLIIDEYIYDPNPSKSKMALKFASGTARFITGSLNKIDKKNITLQTPTANIAIRGTDFTCTVDEFGRSLIILLPDINGLSSGEIIVSTGMGSVTLNKPYESTTATLFTNMPSKPVILDLTLEFIDNMLIVNPPKQNVSYAEESQQTKSADYLDFNDLDIDFLAEDFLDNRNELQFTELDINYLDVNFLEDLLNILDALAIGEDEDELNLQATGIKISGTNIGKDTDTQITTIITGQQISLRRQVSDSMQLDLDGSGSYTLIIVQDGVSNVVKINGGGDSVITITQSE